MRRDIEGLRSVAVLFVLVYHLGVSRLSGGFAGVDVFFVISGFLITSGLIKDTERRGRVSIIDFYARRARRLLPAATLVLVVTSLVGLVLMPRADLGHLASDVAAAALYVVNWTLAFRAVDYLAEDASVSPVQHYWSLSVEEQFYVVVPILMIILALLARRGHIRFRRVLTLSIAGIVAASFVYSVVHTAQSPQTAYFFSTTRVWELGVGALVACALPLWHHLTRVPALWLGGAGLAAVLASGVLVSRETAWPGYAAALPVLGTAAVIAAGVAHSDTPVVRLLGVRPMVWIGGLSYSIYLWHWPLIVFADDLVDVRWWHQVAIAVLSIGLAWASKRFVEDPVRFSGPWSRKPRPALAMGAAGMALSLAAAGLVWVQVPRLSDRPAEAKGAAAILPPPTAVDPGTGTAGPPPSVVPGAGAEITRSGAVYPDPALAPDLVPRYYADECQVREGETEPDPTCVYGDVDGAVTVALVGDSKAGQWFDVVDDVAKERGWRLELYLKSACPFTPAARAPDCRAFTEAAMERLTSDGGRVDLVVTSAVHSTNDKSDPSSAAAYVDGYDAYWSRLEEVGTRILALSDSPSPGSPGYPRYECVEDHPDDFLACAFPANDGSGTPALRAAVERGSSRTFADLNPYICPRTDDGRCPVVVGGVLVYRQGSHVTTAYADSLRPVLERFLGEAVTAADGAG